MNFPEEIKKLRERSLLTQTELAEIVGVVTRDRYYRTRNCVNERGTF